MSITGLDCVDVKLGLLYGVCVCTSIVLANVGMRIGSVLSEFSGSTYTVALALGLRLCCVNFLTS